MAENPWDNVNMNMDMSEMFSLLRQGQIKREKDSLKNWKKEQDWEAWLGKDGILMNAVSIPRNLATERTKEIDSWNASAEAKAQALFNKLTDTKTLQNIVDGAGSRESKINNFNRQALHAKSLGFIHPKTKKEIFFQAKRPKDFDTLIKSLKNTSI